jgi:23S rRNA pseudouridine1911/1915/1917 synthase
MEHVGFPLLGDKLYGQPDWVFLDYLTHKVTDRMRDAVRFPRHCLHAAIVRFPHPDGGHKKVRASLPQDMANVVAGEIPSWILENPEQC